MIEYIQTDKAPVAAGHYSQATKGNGFIFTAITLPINPDNLNAKKASIKEQAEQVIENIFAVIKAAGGDKDTILKMTIFVSDVKLWDQVNEVYEEKFGKHRPARGVLEISNIRKGYDVAMEAIALEK